MPTFYGNGRTYVFLPQESLSARCRRTSRFLRTPPCRGGALTWGIPRFWVPGPVQTEAPYQLSGAQGGSLCPKALGSNKQGEIHSPTLFRLTVELLLWLEAQNIIVRARHIPGCLNVIADHLSRPIRPISTEWSLHPEIVKRIFRLWGTPEVDMFCDSVELPPSSVHVSSSGTTNPSGGCSVSGLAWEVNVHVSSIQSAQQSHSEAPVHPGGRSISRSPLVAETVVVSTPTSSLCGSPPVLSLPSRSSVPAGQYVSDGKSYHLHAWRLSCDTIKQQAFQTRSLGSPQPLRGPQPIACTTIGGFASLIGLQGKGLICLIPQLLRY